MTGLLRAGVIDDAVRVTVVAVGDGDGAAVVPPEPPHPIIVKNAQKANSPIVRDDHLRRFGKPSKTNVANAMYPPPCKAPFVCADRDSLSAEEISGAANWMVNCEVTTPFGPSVVGPKTQVKPAGKFAGQEKLSAGRLPTPALGVIVRVVFPLPEAEEIVSAPGLIAKEKAEVTFTVTETEVPAE